MRRPRRIAAPGSGIVSMTASPMVLTSVPPLAGSSARTERQKSATRAAASWSPCASVRAVKPAMSANRNVASTVVDVGHATQCKDVLTGLAWGCTCEPYETTSSGRAERALHAGEQRLLDLRRGDRGRRRVRRWRRGRARGASRGAMWRGRRSGTCRRAGRARSGAAGRRARLVHRVEVGVGESGVDLDERVEAAEVAPRRSHDPLERSPGVAARRARRPRSPR